VNTVNCKYDTRKSIVTVNVQQVAVRVIELNVESLTVSFTVPVESLSLTVEHRVTVIASLALLLR
jgi:hypothetical protein